MKQTSSQAKPAVGTRADAETPPEQAAGVPLPPLVQEQPAPVPDLTSHRLIRSRLFGGVIRVHKRSLTSVDEFPNDRAATRIETYEHLRARSTPVYRTKMT